MGLNTYFTICDKISIKSYLVATIKVIYPKYYKHWNDAVQHSHQGRQNT